MGIIISAYPACGKSHATKTLTELGMKVADSDSSKFSWIYEDNGEKRRNPNFVEDYLKHIEKAAKENDIVFISSHYEIRQSLRNLGFHFYTVYPKADESVRDEWIDRMRKRGNNNIFIEKQIEMWPKNMENIENESHGILLRLGNGKYLDLEMIDKIKAIEEILEKNGLKNTECLVEYDNYFGQEVINCQNECEVNGNKGYPILGFDEYNRLIKYLRTPIRMPDFAKFKVIDKDFKKDSSYREAHRIVDLNQIWNELETNEMLKDYPGVESDAYMITILSKLKINELKELITDIINESERNDLTAYQKNILDCLYYDVVNVTENKVLEDNKQPETNQEVERD